MAVIAHLKGLPELIYLAAKHPKLVGNDGLLGVIDAQAAGRRGSLRSVCGR